jgi:hypothetical protein
MVLVWLIISVVFKLMLVGSRRLLFWCEVRCAQILEKNLEHSQVAPISDHIYNAHDGFQSGSSKATCAIDIMCADKHSRRF